MEELVRNEELENAITAGTVTVRGRNFVRQEERFLSFCCVVFCSMIVKETNYLWEKGGGNENISLGDRFTRHSWSKI